MLTNDGPTPRGGVRSVAHLTDAAGAATGDPAVATAVEVVEYAADGTELARTYGRTDLPRPHSATEMGDEDTDAFQAGQWDVTVNDGGQHRLVESLEDLSAVLDRAALGEAGFRTTLASLVTMPQWQTMPDGLRQEIAAHLETTRPQ